MHITRSLQKAHASVFKDASKMKNNPDYSAERRSASVG